MTIDTSGKWWVGDTADDIIEYLKAYEAEGYPVHEARVAKCGCGSASFRLFSDQEEQTAKYVCIACSVEKFIADAAEYWDDAAAEKWICICGKDTCNLGAGFSLYEERTAIRWVSVGVRCETCGVLGCVVDWKIGYEPSLQFMDI